MDGDKSEFDLKGVGGSGNHVDGDQEGAAKTVASIDDVAAAPTVVPSDEGDII